MSVGKESIKRAASAGAKKTAAAKTAEAGEMCIRDRSKRGGACAGVSIL